LAPFTNAMV
jgi:hypothetical protein